VASLETRGWFSRSDSASFAIISLRLASATDKSFPPRAVAHHIQTYYDDEQSRQSFEIFDYPFAFPTSASTAEFKRTMLALSRHLKQQHFKRILVFLSTHSDPDRGDLHYQSGYSCVAGDLLDTLLPSSLRKYLQQQDSIFVLLACGAAVNEKASFKHILDLAVSGTFRISIAFSAKNFQPPRASTFLMKFTDKYFFRRYGLDAALTASLSEESGLGSHSNVIVISKDNTGRWIERLYVWSHVSTRPWGVDVSQQCPSCRRIQSWHKPQASNVLQPSSKAKMSKLTLRRIEHRCRFCSYVRSFDKPASLTYLGAMGESGRGKWYVTRRVIS